MTTRTQQVSSSTHKATGRFLRLLAVGCLLALAALFSACGNAQPPQQDQALVASASQNITYNSDPHAVVIRTFVGGGAYGTLAPGPQISIYGDGSYILGLTQKGQLQPDDFQHLLSNLVDTYGLLDFKRQQFADVPDQNATFLELALNNKTTQLVYGSFGNQSESKQDLAEYQSLGQALTAITASLKGPTQTYTASQSALLVRQITNPDLATVQDYYSTDLKLAQVATFECGALPEDVTSHNHEIGCLKYTIPQNAQLLTAGELQTFQSLLGNQSEGDLREAGLYYSVTLRPLLPDELQSKTLAMLGSSQDSYQGITLHSGAIPTA